MRLEDDAVAAVVVEVEVGGVAASMMKGVALTVNEEDAEVVVVAEIVVVVAEVAVAATKRQLPMWRMSKTSQVSSNQRLRKWLSKPPCTKQTLLFC